MNNNATRIKDATANDERAVGAKDLRSSEVVLPQKANTVPTMRGIAITSSSMPRILVLSAVIAKMRSPGSKRPTIVSAVWISGARKNTSAALTNANVAAQASTDGRRSLDFFQ